MATSLLKEPVADCSKDSKERRNARDRVRENVIENSARTRNTNTDSRGDLSAPFDNAQDNRHMRLFQQPAG
jgi:hypothetical protein